MNRLKREKQEMILSLLVEGNSVRSAERITGAHRDTIIRLMCRAGERCEHILDERMRNLNLRYIQTDEIWTFVFKKKEKLYGFERYSDWGDQYVFIAMDTDSKLVPCYAVGKRTTQTALRLMRELRERNPRRIHLTTDAFRGYLPAVRRAFGENIDFAQLVKHFGKRDSDNKYEGYSQES